MAYESSNIAMVVIGLLEQNVWAELAVVWVCICVAQPWDGSSVHLPLHLIFQAFPGSLTLTHSPEYMHHLWLVPQFEFHWQFTTWWRGLDMEIVGIGAADMLRYWLGPWQEPPCFYCAVGDKETLAGSCCPFPFPLFCFCVVTASFLCFWWSNPELESHVMLSSFLISQWKRRKQKEKETPSALQASPDILESEQEGYKLSIVR